MSWNDDWDDDDWDDDDWDDDDDDDDRPRRRKSKRRRASSGMNTLSQMLFGMNSRILPQDDREDFRERLQELREDLGDADDEDDIEDVLEEMEDLREDISEAREDAWEDAWENDWRDMFDLTWDDSFWETKGKHLPLHVSLSPEEKGIIGEKRIAHILSQLPVEEYHVMNDVLLEIGNTSSQIDHVVVSRYGVFVIETKNYAGIIFGEEDDQRWTQVIGEQRNSFYNPLKQNQRHVQVISKCAQRPEELFIPIVVFSRHCELQVDTYTPVLHSDTLLEYMQSFEQIVLDDIGMKEIEERVRGSWNPSYLARLRHKEKYRYKK